MAIQLNGALIKAICRRKFGASKIVEQLLYSWEGRYGSAPSEATVRRWMGGPAAEALRNAG